MQPHDYVISGEQPLFLIVSADKKQAANLLGYVRGFFQQSSLLHQLVFKDEVDGIELKSGCRLAVVTNSYRSVRGYTIPVALLDEISLYRDETSAQPDQELVAAIRPAQLTVLNPLLLGFGSPLARRGVLYRAWRENFAQAQAPVLVWHSTTRQANNTVSEETIAKELARDSSRARSEYLAEWRDDSENFLSIEECEAAAVKGRHELPRQPGIEYFAFADMSGGGADESALAIAHCDDRRNVVVVDALRSRLGGRPEDHAKEFAYLARSYGCFEVHGDSYAKQWVSNAFESEGVSYRKSERTTSENYLEFLPHIKSGQVELLDHVKTISQLADLERSALASGRDRVDHPPGAHDDCAAVAAGASVLAFQRGGVLGVVEYLKSPAAQQELDKLIAAPPLLMSSKKDWNPSPMSAHSPQQAGPCPRCGCELIQRISNFFRCAQCGDQRTTNGAPMPFLGPNRNTVGGWPH